jgi:non-canonical purine NTP pyrophosphatase (RdgB/HAM1 family)
MKNFTFITGNQAKADYLARLLDLPVEHQKIELDEIQSIDLQEIVRHKVRQAYEIAAKPVLVEDVSLEFDSLGKLPGPFIKWFIEQMEMQDICDLLLNKDRSATARCVFGYFDGRIEKYFEGSMKGKIALSPAGENGYGWDKIFIPVGYEITRAQMSVEENEKNYLQIKPIERLREFLE